MISQISKDLPLFQIAEKLIGGADSLKRSRILQISQIAGDASGREFYRIVLSQSKVPTVILMGLNSKPGPVGRYQPEKTQDDTFVEIGRFLLEEGISVPKILVDARKERYLLVEDVGETSLMNMTQTLMAQGDVERVAALYKQAVDIIFQLQRCYSNSNIAFKRAPSFEQLRSEVDEFLLYYLGRYEVKSSEKEVLKSFFDAVCESVDSHPKKLSHFDYTSFNLFYQPIENQVRVIDFQDACLTSDLRDLVSLINDRDMDAILTPDLQRILVKYFMEKMENKSGFVNRYYEMAMHWDLRVSGRFSQLVDFKHMEKYEEWIPGTLRRLGRTLVLVESRFPQTPDVLDIISKYSKEFREGIVQKWVVV